jgi:hypothetical protein
MQVDGVPQSPQAGVAKDTVQGVLGDPLAVLKA